jgi:hypothetical protein
MLRSAGSRQHDKTKDIARPTLSTKTEPTPRLTVRKIGIVSRDYNHKFSNRFRDFSATFSRVLRVLDEKGCDTVLFSPWSIVPRKSFVPVRSLRGLRHIKSVFYEEFTGTGKKRKTQFVVFHRRGIEWQQHTLPGGGFAKLRGSWQAKKRKVACYIRQVLPGRVLGNCCVIICGETTGVPYHPDRGKVGDDFLLRRSLPKKVKVILNPIHNWMSRFEMPLKRKFLSQDGRWVISVWNKGKQDKNGKRRDAKGDPWTVFHNGREMAVELIQNEEGVDIGIVWVS